MKIKLTKLQQDKWLNNQLTFLKPLVVFVATLYFTPIILNLSEAGHMVSLADFVPSQAVITAIVLYLINALYDLIRKWGAAK